MRGSFQMADVARAVRAAIVIAVCCAVLGGAQQKLEKITDMQRDAALQMLDSIRDEVKIHYFDPKRLNGDFDTRYKAAKDKLKQVDTLNEAYAVTNWMLEVLNDSHTFFVPPAVGYKIENGWRMKFVGDHCYLTAVKPGSDAEAQGLRAGGQVVSLEGFPLERATFWKLAYAVDVLGPRVAMHIVSAAPDGQRRERLVKAEVEKLPGGHMELGQQDPDAKLLAEWQMVEMGDPLMIWKMPNFKWDERQVEHFIKAAKRHQSLILDLRGNGGGAEPTMTRMLGSFFDHDVRIGDLVTRSPQKPFMAKTPGADKIFSGKLMVLTDSQSASAAEIVAHVVQLEKRGTVLGDRSAGSVMRAEFFHGMAGRFAGIIYTVHVTVADLLMADGKSLERTGVTPDELILPTPEDLAAGRGPVLARAAKVAGVELSPEKAGSLFPVIWLRPKQ
jgi:C-terminal processing protease CtpA/Prc